jgi:hypothetical protein
VLLPRTNIIVTHLDLKPTCCTTCIRITEHRDCQNCSYYGNHHEYTTWIVRIWEGVCVLCFGFPLSCFDLFVVSCCQILGLFRRCGGARHINDSILACAGRVWIFLLVRNVLNESRASSPRWRRRNATRDYVRACRNAKRTGSLIEWLTDLASGDPRLNSF